MDLLTLLSKIPTPAWVALSGGIGSLGTWIVSMRQVSVSVERMRLKWKSEAVAEESAERAAFRAMLLSDISDLRQLVKECEIDRDALRTRVNVAEEQILVLKASNEIMDRWLTFFKDRNAMEPRPGSGSLNGDARP